jgi:excinuclease ABC subunit C
MLRFLETTAADVEFVAVRTEQEALLLENTIIKKRRPLYNVKLKVDKAFLMLRLDRREAWPWFRLVRRRKDDGAEYFGPYASAKSVRRSLRLLHRMVPLRDCKDAVFLNRARPCIKHEIGRCPAPCVGLIERSDYDLRLEEAVGLLRGRAVGLLYRLHAEMERAAADLQFERARDIKGQIAALRAVVEQQTVVGPSDADQDAIGLWRAEGGTTAVVVVLAFRGGKLESSRRFRITSALPDELLLSDLLARLYEGDRFVPAEVLVPAPPEDADVIADWLADKRGAPVVVRVPQRGAGRRHVEMAVANAQLAATESGASFGAGAAELARMLGLTEPPQRIHCFDVSTIQGRDTVAARVAFLGGQPHKDGYRKFRISGEAAADDFSAMQEAVRRSLELCARDEEGDELPDLAVIDGGRGQLEAARRAVDELGLLDDLVLVGLAKSRLRGIGDARRASAERLFVPGRAAPVALAPGAPATLLLAAIRDEAHRFAITYHRQMRSRLTSELDSIPGIGPARRRLLLRHFGSLEGVRAADLDALRSVLPEQVAERVHTYLRSQPAGGGGAG